MEWLTILTIVNQRKLTLTVTELNHNATLQKKSQKKSRTFAEIQVTVHPSGSADCVVASEAAAANKDGTPPPSSAIEGLLGKGEPLTDAAGAGGGGGGSAAAAAADAAGAAAGKEGGGGKAKQVVDPWTVQGGEDGIDYQALIDSFGSKAISKELLARFEKVTGEKPHHWLRRGLFYSHRDLNFILDTVEKGEKFYLYTGRGPSSGSLHMGHMIPFLFTAYLQRVFDVPLVIQLTDDEKFLWKNISLEDCVHFGRENTKDIIACGVDPKKTFIFNDVSYIGQMYAFFSLALSLSLFSFLFPSFSFLSSSSPSSFCSLSYFPFFSLFSLSRFPDLSLSLFLAAASRSPSLSSSMIGTQQSSRSRSASRSIKHEVSSASPRATLSESRPSQPSRPHHPFPALFQSHSRASPTSPASSRAPLTKTLTSGSRAMSRRGCIFTNRR